MYKYHMKNVTQNQDDQRWWKNICCSCGKEKNNLSYVLKLHMNRTTNNNLPSRLLFFVIWSWPQEDVIIKVMTSLAFLFLCCNICLSQVFCKFTLTLPKCLSLHTGCLSLGLFIRSSDTVHRTTSSKQICNVHMYIYLKYNTVVVVLYVSYYVVTDQQ